MESSVSPYAVGHQSKESTPQKCHVLDSKNIDTAEKLSYKSNIPYKTAPTKLDNRLHLEITRNNSDCVSNKQLNSYTFESVDKHQQLSTISASSKDDNLSPIISSSQILQPCMTRNVSDQCSLSHICDVSQQESCFSPTAEISDRIPVTKDVTSKKFSASNGDENDVPSSHRYGHVKAWTKNTLKTKLVCFKSYIKFQKCCNTTVFIALLL